MFDLYINGDFDRDILTARKIGIEKEIVDLKLEQASLQDHLDSVIITDAEVEAIEAICAEIEVGLDRATVEDKKRYCDLLDVRGFIA